MRQIYIPALKRDVSALAFGSASLGSRISASAGQRAVESALDLGISWFDVAPPYGDGRAEDLLGTFLASRRKNIVICTKFGISRPLMSLSSRILRPVAQFVVERAPAFRAFARRARPASSRALINPDGIEASVTDSLRRLRTDYIDVLAIHDPSPAEATDDRIFSALDRLKQKGFIRAVSLAGSPDSIMAGLVSRNVPDFAQFPNTPFANAAKHLSALPWPRKPIFITHGAFGSNALDRMRALRATRGQALAALAKQFALPLNDPEEITLLRFAFSANPDGIVLASMFSPGHLKTNVAVAAISPNPKFAGELVKLLASTEDTHA